MAGNRAGSSVRVQDWPKPFVDLREVLNAIRYLVRGGVGWRMLPKDFPPWQTVCW
jgi:putative transposase